jgi:hypothetical protein
VTIADNISAAAQTPTDATARRLDLLHQSGNGWLDPQSQVALAQSSASDQGIVDQASSIRQTLNQQAAQKGTSLIASVGHFFGDPVLQKTPSAALGLQQYLLQRQGWAPIAEDDLRHIQQQLADGGYLDKSQINGVWTPQAQQAFYSATSDHVDHQMKEGGGFSIGRTLGAFMPSHWIPAIVGAAKAIPHEATDLWSSITGIAAETAHDVAHPTGLIPGTAENKAGVQQFNVQAAHDETMFGNGPLVHLGTVTPADVQAHQGRLLLNAVNGILTVAPVTRAGSVGVASFDAARAAAANTAIHDAAGTSMFRGLLTDLGPEAAQRGLVSSPAASIRGALPTRRWGFSGRGCFSRHRSCDKQRNRSSTCSTRPGNLCPRTTRCGQGSPQRQAHESLACRQRGPRLDRCRLLVLPNGVSRQRKDRSEITTRSAIRCTRNI